MRSFDENLRVDDKEENPNNALLPLLEHGKVTASEIIANSSRRKFGSETSETNDKIHVRHLTRLNFVQRKM